MSVEKNALSLKFRELILNTRKPLIFRQSHFKSKYFQRSLEDWCKTLDDTSGEVEFERMSRRCGESPQWERKRAKVQMTPKQFLQEHGMEQDYWSGMNYKRAFEMPFECTAELDLSCFGIPQGEDDCTFWLSSKGANTPCHYDSYGCNVVMQAYGRKSWLLFPPNTPLTATRIPYEESSIYSLENFYAPNSHSKEHFSKLHSFAYKCVLEAGDVLVIPRHWWHFVEAVDTSLSINCWLPLENDLEVQIEECIVKFLIENFIKGAGENTKSHVLNPNQLEEITEDDELFGILRALLEEREATGSSEEKKSVMPFPYQYLSENAVDELLETIPGVLKVPKVSSEEFAEILRENGKRFDREIVDPNSPMDHLKEILINSVCSPSVISQIKNEFYKRLKIYNAKT